MNQRSGASVFFADLHHPGGRDEQIEELFSQIPTNTEKIFLLGDIFHYWLNDPVFIQDLYAPFLRRLERWADEGILLFFLEGNRDFLASHYLDTLPWIDVLINPSIIDVVGRTVYIGHGDELCWNDWPYQMYKTFIRSAWMRFAADHVSGPVRKRVVQAMAKASSRIVAGKKPAMLAVPDKAYQQVIESGVQAIIHGHLHQTYRSTITTSTGVGEIYAFGWQDNQRNLIYFNHESPRISPAKASC